MGAKNRNMDADVGFFINQDEWWKSIKDLSGIDSDEQLMNVSLGIAEWVWLNLSFGEEVEVAGKDEMGTLTEIDIGDIIEECVDDEYAGKARFLFFIDFEDRKIDTGFFTDQGEWWESLRALSGIDDDDELLMNVSLGIAEWAWQALAIDRVSGVVANNSAGVPTQMDIDEIVNNCGVEDLTNKARFRFFENLIEREGDDENEQEL